MYDRDKSSLRRASFGLWMAQGQSTPGLWVSLWESKRANHTHSKVRVPSGGQRASTHQSCSKNFLCKSKSWFDAGFFLKRAALLSTEVKPEPAVLVTVLRHKPWKIRYLHCTYCKKILKTLVVLPPSPNHSASEDELRLRSCHWYKRSLLGWRGTPYLYLDLLLPES